MTTATETTGTANRLERETCSRCNGSGSYSYCHRWGSVCFKCGGKKEVLTRRGAVANEYLKALRSKRADRLAVGDQVMSGAITMGGDPFDAWFTIQSITTGANGRLTFEMTSKVAGPMHASGINPDRMFRTAQTKEQAVATLNQALAYQATLTKSGTPRKRS